MCVCVCACGGRGGINQRGMGADVSPQTFMWETSIPTKSCDSCQAAMWQKSSSKQTQESSLSSDLDMKVLLR